MYDKTSTLNYDFSMDWEILKIIVTLAAMGALALIVYDNLTRD